MFYCDVALLIGFDLSTSFRAETIDAV